MNEIRQNICLESIICFFVCQSSSSYIPKPASGPLGLIAIANFFLCSFFYFAAADIDFVKFANILTYSGSEFLKLKSYRTSICVSNMSLLLAKL